MNTTAPTSRAAFTLIELLTVIAIIAILMGLLFPAIGTVKESARKTQAKNDVTQIVSAVKQYYTEYGKYPPVQESAASAAEKDVVIGDPEADALTDNSALFNTLRSIPDGLNTGPDYKLNPRRIIFFEGKAVTDIKAPRGGFTDKSESEKKGSFYDPWGKQYCVVIDSNYDNVIKLDEQYTDFSSKDAPRVGVGAFSMGKDNKVGTKGDKSYRKGTTPSDDVISWQ